MARKGLPAKYAKMGFAKGWRAYKAAKRKKTKKGGSMPRKRTTRRRRRSTRKASSRRRTTRRRRTGLRGSRIVPRLKAPRRPAQKTVNVATNAAVGVGGAIGSATLVRFMPIADARVRALTQAAIGALVLMMVRRRNRLWKLAGAGATMAGMLSLTKEALPQLPLMAGWDEAQNLYMGNVSWKSRLASDPRLTNFNKNVNLSAPKEFMGVPTSNFQRGYGGKFALANQ